MLNTFTYTEVANSSELSYLTGIKFVGFWSQLESSRVSSPLISSHTKKQSEDEYIYIYIMCVCVCENRLLVSIWNETNIIFAHRQIF